eukprot:GHVO01068247.1.p1 GENE.GHVO01068247.1~~GHVO01068247.1.p1  ORF type:complete len:100 (-),score=15.47 GHVO01068247.1:155-454(-)
MFYCNTNRRFIHNGKAIGSDTGNLQDWITGWIGVSDMVWDEKVQFRGKEIVCELVGIAQGGEVSSMMEGVDGSTDEVLVGDGMLVGKTVDDAQGILCSF